MRTRRHDRWHAVAGLASLTLVAAVMGCDGTATEPPRTRGPLTLAAVWEPPPGTPTVGTVGAQTLGVRVTTADDRPVRGVRVAFVDVGGSGTISSLLDSTDRDGLAVVQWVPGTRSGPQAALAFLVSATDTQRVRFPLTLAPGPAAVLDLSAADSSFDIGQTAAITAVFRDAYGNATAPPAPVSYASARADVATVSATGVIEGVSPGFTGIAVESGTFRDSLQVSVRSATPTPTVTSYFSAGDRYVIAFAPNGVALTGRPFEPAIRRFDAATQTDLPYINLERGAWDIAVVPGTTQALVTTTTDSLYVVDFAIDSVVRSIAIPDVAIRVRVSPDGAFAYAALGLGGVVRVNLADGAILPLALPLPASIVEVTLSSDGSALFLTTLEGAVVRIQTATMGVTHTVELGSASQLQGLALSNDQTRLAVVSRGIFSIEEGQLISMSADSLSDFRAAPLPFAFEVIADPTGPRFLASSSTPGTVTFFDQATMEALVTVPTTVGGRGFAVQPGTTNVWQGGYETMVRIAFP